MKVTVGTFNLNNLFSRYNFKAEIGAIQPKEAGLTIEYKFTDPESYRIRAYKGRLVKAKEKGKTEMIAKRITEMDVDVLAVQEVEDIDTLKYFNKEYLKGMYAYQALIEGNDPRLIDVGLLSKYPIGGITSWQRATHPDKPQEPVFGRDLLEVEILDKDRKDKLFTVYNNHLKSNLILPGQNKAEEEKKNKERRKQQAETIIKIVKSRMDTIDSFIILGDMNDTPDSEALKAFTKDAFMGMVNGLKDAKETQPPKPDNPPPASEAWTHRYKPSGKPAQYELYDQIWLSPALAGKLTEAKIGRRKNLTGDGSDHDPAWVVLEI
jgi:endonuclease/exonuclease/phosphatase family metal-dependent hydrolase